VAKGSEAKAGKPGRSAKAASNDDDEDALKASIDGITQGARDASTLARRTAGSVRPTGTPADWERSAPGGEALQLGSIRSSTKHVCRAGAAAGVRMRRPNDPLRRRG